MEISSFNGSKSNFYSTADWESFNLFNPLIIPIFFSLFRNTANPKQYLQKILFFI